MGLGQRLWFSRAAPAGHRGDCRTGLVGAVLSADRVGVMAAGAVGWGSLRSEFRAALAGARALFQRALVGFCYGLLTLRGARGMGLVVLSTQAALGHAR